MKKRCSFLFPPLKGDRRPRIARLANYGLRGSHPFSPPVRPQGMVGVVDRIESCYLTARLRKYVTSEHWNVLQRGVDKSRGDKCRNVGIVRYFRQSFVDQPDPCEMYALKTQGPHFGKIVHFRHTTCSRSNEFHQV